MRATVTLNLNTCRDACPRVCAGESYGGVYVPLLARALLRHNQRIHQQQQLQQAAGATPGSPSHSGSSTASGSDRVYNIVGYVVGNAVTDDMYDFGGQVDFAFSLGLIDPDTFHLVKQTCKVSPQILSNSVTPGSFLL